MKFHGVGVTNKAAYPALHTPKSVLQSTIAVWAPTPAIKVPNVNPAAA